MLGRPPVVGCGGWPELTPGWGAGVVVFPLPSSVQGRGLHPGPPCRAGVFPLGSLFTPSVLGAGWAFTPLSPVQGGRRTPCPVRVCFISEAVVWAENPQAVRPPASTGDGGTAARHSTLPKSLDPATEWSGRAGWKSQAP